jgi:hypothetical protein
LAASKITGTKIAKTQNQFGTKIAKTQNQFGTKKTKSIRKENLERKSERQDFRSAL